MEQYNRYNLEDFLNDDLFIRHCRHEPAASRIWDAWLATNPENLLIYRQAFDYLSLLLQAERLLAPTEMKETGLTDLRNRILLEERRLRSRRLRRMTFAAAAACLLVALACYWYLNSTITISTQYGEHRKILLPDNSTVILNAHSSLSYRRVWWLSGKREVWLEGEGLFQVGHAGTEGNNAAPGHPFTAFAGKLAVQVLGTTFNIKSRRNEVSVALMEGKLRILGSATPGQGPVLLKKGESIQYKDEHIQVATIARQPSQPLAWLEDKIIARGLTVQDIINTYQDTRGYTIILDNPALAKKTIDGTISIGADDNLLFMLANILNTDVERKGDTIYLRSK